MNVNTQLFWMKEFMRITGVKSLHLYRRTSKELFPLLSQEEKKKKSFASLIQAEKAALGVVLFWRQRPAPERVTFKHCVTRVAV